MTSTRSVPRDEVLAMLVDGLLDFVERVVVPLERAHEDALGDPRRVYLENGAKAPWLLDLERQVRLASAEAGYYTSIVPERLGGGGQGPVALFTLWEALYHHCGPARLLPYWSLAHFATGPSAVLEPVLGTPSEAWLDALCSGKRSMCFALSEPDAGTDAWALRTEAYLDGDEWVISGTKQWTTNGPYADVALVFAVTDRDRARERKGGISAFLVPTDTPGFQVDSVITLFGHIGGEEGILSLDEVRVPAHALVGARGEGFALALGAVNEGRLYNCARSIGLARWCLDRAVEYAKERRTFGKALADHQAIQWHLADSATELYGARCASLDCAARIASGDAAIKELSMAKLLATEAASRAIDRCTQVLGAMGVTTETRFYDAWQQVRTLRIAEGSSEILRRSVARRLLSGDGAL